jgi:hypothetical protein
LKNVRHNLERDLTEFSKQKDNFNMFQQQQSKRKESEQNTELSMRKINAKPETILDLNTKGLLSVDLYDYVNITILILTHNKLRSVDVSTNTQLSHLYLYKNQLTQLDFSRNTKLAFLYLS